MWIMAAESYENLFPIQPGAVLPHGIYSAAFERICGTFPSPLKHRNCNTFVEIIYFLQEL